MHRFLYLIRLAFQSACNRKSTLILIGLSIALSTTLLLGIEKLRVQVRESFVQSVSGTDLVVGARTGDIQLMLYAVFHLGSATNNMDWSSVKMLEKSEAVKWVIPISLGDSHKGFSVIGTDSRFFDHYRYRGGRKIALTEGRPFSALYDTVIGATVASELGYKPGDKIILAHGTGNAGLRNHGDKPFTVSGIMAATGTPVDRSVLISLSAMEAIHIDWQGGVPLPGFSISAEQTEKMKLEPESVTAAFVGLKKRSRVFSEQRRINEYRNEALMAVMPGVVMDRIWSFIGTGEKMLVVISALVTLTGLAGLVSSILAGLAERKRELAVLRAAGARPRDILCLTLFEALLLVTGGILGGLVLLYALILAASPFAAGYGIMLEATLPNAREWLYMLGIAVAGTLAGLIPALRAYRISLSDGLSAR